MLQNPGEFIPQRQLTSASEKKLFTALGVLALLAGLLQALAERFYIEPDGVNYLDVAYAYLRHDFHNAVNAYWSPLYSWLLALVMAMTHPAPYWESTALHGLNFFIYFLSLVCFAFFYRELTSLKGRENAPDEKQPLPRWSWHLFGFSLFVYASLELIRLSTDSPDMLVSAVCFLATGILLRMRRGVASWPAYGALGGVLALGYLAKAVMFPISFVFLFASFFASRNRRKAVPRAALAMVVFLLVASPWLFVLSKAKGRFTFGDTGSLNYAWYVHSVGTPLHGIRQLGAEPTVEEFGTPVAGTYPPWYDPSYWSEGVHPDFEWRPQLRVLSKNLGEYFRLLSAEKGIAVGLLALVLFSGRPGEYCSAFLKLWPFWLAPLATLGIYALVHVETRFLGAAVVILWLTLFAAVRLPRSDISARVWASCLVAVSAALALTLAFDATKNLSTVMRRPSNVEWEAAQELSRLNLHKGDPIALLGHSNVADYYAHLANIRIVAQVPAEGVPSYWGAGPESRRRVLNILAQTGAVLFVTRIPPPHTQGENWQPLGSTGYYALVLPKPGNSN